MKKSHARIASAWDCRNAATPARSSGRDDAAGLRISHTVDAAMLTLRLASSPSILRYPHSGFSRASRRTRAWMFRRVARRPVLACADLAAQRRRTMSRCQRRIVSGVTSSRVPGAALWVSRRAEPRAGHGLPSSAAGDLAAAVAGR